jgi:hypothetical protein
MVNRMTYIQKKLRNPSKPAANGVYYFVIDTHKYIFFQLSRGPPGNMCTHEVIKTNHLRVHPNSRPRDHQGGDIIHL